MATLAWICFGADINADAIPEKTVFDFSKAMNASAWEVVNDGVMGGKFRVVFSQCPVDVTTGDWSKREAIQGGKLTTVNAPSKGDGLQPL